MTYEPRWDIDSQYGETGENSMRGLLNLQHASFEVKHKRYCDDKFYVEVAQRPQRLGRFRPSGINTSEAEYWVYEIAETGIKVLIPRPLLKAAARTSDRREEKDGSNPTIGRLVSFSELLRTRLREAA